MLFRVIQLYVQEKKNKNKNKWRRKISSYDVKQSADLQLIIAVKMLSRADGKCKLKSMARYPNKMWHQTHLTTRSAASSDHSSNWCTHGSIMIWLQRMLTRSTLRRKPVISCRRTRLLRRFDPPLPPFPRHLDLFVVARSATGQTGSCRKIQSIRVNALKPTNTPPPLPHVLPTSEAFCIALHTFGRGGRAAGRWLPSTRLVYIKETHVVFVLRSAAGMNP